MSPPTRRDALRALGIAGVAGLAGCSALSGGDGDPDPNEQPPDSLGTAWSPPADEWRFPRADLRNSGHTTTGVTDRSTVDWRDTQESLAGSDRSHGSLAGVAGDSVLTAVGRAETVSVQANDVADGTRQWQRAIDYGEHGYSPFFAGIVGDTLYLTDLATDVIALDASDGSVRWRHDLHERLAEDVPVALLATDGDRDRFSTAALATPETVFVQSTYGLHGLAPSDGSERWRIYLGGGIDGDRAYGEIGSLAVLEDRLWVSYGWPDPAAIEVELEADTPSITRTSVPLEQPARPVIADDGTVGLTHRIAWSSRDRGPIAAGVGSTVRWVFQGLAASGPASYAPIATASDRVYACESRDETGEVAVFSLGVESGGLGWLHRESAAGRLDGSDLGLSSPVVPGDTLLVGYGNRPDAGTGRGVLLALSTDDGAVRWRRDLPLAPDDIAVAGGRIYVGGDHSGVLALGDPD